MAEDHRIAATERAKLVRAFEREIRAALKEAQAEAIADVAKLARA